MTLKSTIPIFDDESGYPYGKWRGTKFKNVPVEYLHWVWHNTIPDRPEMMAVHSYIQKNLSYLKEENEDLIWSK